MTDLTKKSFRARGIVSSVAVLLAVVGYWVSQVLPLQNSKGFSWANFREYFPYDQYSYLAIMVNVRNGNLDSVEPFSETGSNYYPRLYYVFLGLVARLFNADSVTVWQVVGVGIQLLMVVAVSLLIIRLTRVPILGALGFVPFMIGTFAQITEGNWYRTQENHSVLWGPFGTFFTLNGESSAMAIAVIAGCIVLFVVSRHRDFSQRALFWRGLSIIFCFALIGMLANVQTYSFLTATYLAVYVSAVYGMLLSGKWFHWVLSVSILITVLFAGNWLAATVGPLVALVAGAMGALPGLYLLFIKHKWIVSLAMLALAVFASPTILGTLFGLANKDDFLTFRELSSGGLGVPYLKGLTSGIVPLAFLLVLAIAGWYFRRRLWIAVALGMAVSWSLISTNDRWGPTQEPYRFWIDGFILIAVLGFPLVLGAIALIVKKMVYSVRERQESVRQDALKPPVKKPVLVGVFSVVIFVVPLGISFSDFPGFARYVSSNGTASFSDPQAMAIRQVSEPLTSEGSSDIALINRDSVANELVFNDPCISPFRLKALTGLPIAFYNRGLAWPMNEPAIRELLSMRENSIFDQEQARSAGVRYLLTDSSCSARWDGAVSGDQIKQVTYDNDGTSSQVTLWRLES